MTAIPSRLTHIKNSVLSNILFGNRPSPELAAILLVYFVQGVLGLSRLAVSFFLKDELGLSPTQVATMMGVVMIPWVIKPLFGFISDGVPILGYRRRPYLILAGLAGAIAWISMATWVHSAWDATGAIALSSLAIALSDVIVDSIVVERARVESQEVAGSLQSLCWGTSALGGLLTAYFSGSLLELVSVQTVFGITACFPLIVALVAGLINEEPISPGVKAGLILGPNQGSIPAANTSGEQSTAGASSSPSQLQMLWQAIQQRSIWMPALFIFLWQATPSSGSAFFFFTTNDLGFQPEFLGRVQLVTSIAAILGIWIFQRFLKSVPVRSIIGWSMVLSTLLGLTSLILVTHTNRALGISDQWFSLGDTLILTVMGEIAFMPLLVVAARICPAGVEATLFALLMSVFNLAGLVSQEGGALLTHFLGVTETNFDQLWLLVLITNLSSLLPLPLLGLLPNSDIRSELQENGTADNNASSDFTPAIVSSDVS
ncbi:MAG: folate/biopterin family MFS transporter [Cyanobacteria bacterium P01_F01_bin.150]